MLYIKGFDKNLCCRGFQFEVGKEYKIDNDAPPELCSDSVFHFCVSLQSVHSFYSCHQEAGNRFCYIECLSDVVSDDEKAGCKHIRIVEEIVGGELNLLLGLVNGNVGLFNVGSKNTGDRNTGDENTGDRNTGDENTGAWNTGDENTGDRNTGDENTGDWNTGDWNTGDFNTGNLNTGDKNTGGKNTGDKNTGDMNTGDLNTGDWNTGGKNTGDLNTGDLNTGDWNTGDWNTGIFNSCNFSSGVFCKKDPAVKIFDIDSGMTMKEFKDSKFYRAIMSSDFTLTKWDIELNKTVPVDFKEACVKWWGDMEEGNKEIIKLMPNFNPEVFEDITGVKV